MKKIIIVLLIVILVGIGFFVFLKLFSAKEIKNSNQGIVEKTKEVVNIKEQQEQEEKKTEEEKSLDTLKAQLTLQARLFIERYGTYSSDSGYSNLRDLKPLISQDLMKEVDKKIEQGINSKNFFSYTTKVASLKLTEFKEDEKAVFTVKVQEQKEDKNHSVFKQKTVELIFVKENNQWKVDKINYQ